MPRPLPDFLANTRASYDALAEAYADTFRDEMARQPVERAALALFASVVD